jgi:pimeloyl-ACP methyl ester carboxylesterase
MPMALFLTAVTGISDSVILVRTKKNDAFRSGIAGVGKGMEHSFSALADTVRRRLDLSDADDAPLVIGTSGGGLPALIFSDYLSCKRVVMVGPNSTDDRRWEGSTPLAAVLDRHQTAQNQAHVVVCYGAESRDASKVGAWRRDLPAAQLLAVPGAGHNALFTLCRRNELAEQLRTWTE